MIRTEDLLDFTDPDAIRIKGHRIGLEHILALYRDGYSAEEIAQEFPGLELEKVYAAIAYYLANQAEVEGYLRRIDEWVEKSILEQQNMPAARRLAALLENAIA